jgi:uncharacterized membrane protein YjdF
MSAAASQGHTEMCKFLRAQQCSWDARSTITAARCGHVDVLRWLMDNGCPSTVGLVAVAVRGGSVEVLAFLQQQGLLTDTLLTDMLNRAARCNALAAAKWLLLRSG